MIYIDGKESIDSILLNIESKIGQVAQSTSTMPNLTQDLLTAIVQGLEDVQTVITNKEFVVDAPTNNYYDNDDYVTNNNYDNDYITNYDNDDYVTNNNYDNDYITNNTTNTYNECKTDCNNLPASPSINIHLDNTITNVDCNTDDLHDLINKLHKHVLINQSAKKCLYIKLAILDNIGNLLGLAGNMEACNQIRMWFVNNYRWWIHWDKPSFLGRFYTSLQ